MDKYKKGDIVSIREIHGQHYKGTFKIHKLHKIDSYRNENVYMSDDLVFSLEFMYGSARVVRGTIEIISFSGKYRPQTICLYSKTLVEIL